MTCEGAVEGGGEGGGWSPGEGLGPVDGAAGHDGVGLEALFM